MASFFNVACVCVRSVSVRSTAYSARSVQSSLLSEDLLLPDEAVYSKYDDAIATVDTDMGTGIGPVTAGGDRVDPSPAVSKAAC
jgi:hypothetical protein